MNDGDVDEMSEEYPNLEEYPKLEVAALELKTARTELRMERVRLRTARWIGAQFGEGVRARFEREFPLRNTADNGDGECRAATRRQRTLAEECHWCHAPIGVACVGISPDYPPPNNFGIVRAHWTSEPEPRR